MYRDFNFGNGHQASRPLEAYDDFLGFFVTLHFGDSQYGSHLSVVVVSVGLLGLVLFIFNHD